MEVAVTMPPETRLGEVAGVAQRAERLGFDTLHVPETVRDPFSTSALAVEHTSRITVRTSMVVAFPRSPMVTALAAWELAAFSAGRFELGVGSQVRGNIVDRFSATWTDPVGQLRDYLLALRAIFAAFQGEATLDVELEHYRFTRLQPYFNPGPIDGPAPPLYVGGVNAAMVRMAGAQADGFVCHPTSSHPVTLREHTLPLLDDGAAAAGRARPRVLVGPKPVLAADRRGVVEARSEARRELAFLYSTPAYRTQLELLGHAGLGPALSGAAQRQDWNGLATLLPDDLLDDLVPVTTYDELPAVLAERYAGACDGIVLALGDPAHDERLGRAVSALREV